MNEREPRVTGGDATGSTGTSRSLIEAARIRDPAAWERLVSLYAPLILHWCRQQGLRDDDAPDVFQDVLQAIASHIGTFRKDPSRGTFRGWLRIITRNKVNDAFRRRQREPAGVGGSEALTKLAEFPEPIRPDNDSSDAGIPSLLRRGLELVRNEFEPRTWQAFWQTAIEGRAPADVAGDLGMSPGAVRVAKSRVLHRLRVELRDRAV